MKKLIFALFLFFTSQTFAQFTVATSDGDPINDGDLFTYSSTQYPNNSLEFVVTNTTNQDIDVVINVISITNTNGSGMEICFGLCYSGISAHTSYPTDTPYHLAANSSSEPHGNHILNNATNGSMVLEYVLKFTQVDGSGNEIGSPITITYRYDPNAASIRDVAKFDFSVYPTIIKDNILNLDTNLPLNINFADLQGKEVKQSTINSGKSTINLSDLNSGTYFLIATDNNGRESFKKIIIQ